MLVARTSLEIFARRPVKSTLPSVFWMPIKNMQILEIFADLHTGFNASTTRLLDQISPELMLIIAGRRRPVKSMPPPSVFWMPIKNIQILEIFADLPPGFNASTTRHFGQISTELMLIVAGKRRPVKSTLPRACSKRNPRSPERMQDADQKHTDFRNFRRPPPWI